MCNRILPLLACLLVLVFSAEALANDEAMLADLTSLRQQYPHDVDHALARGQLLARLGKDEAALLDLRDATTLAPDYEDAWRVRYRILSRQNGDEARRELEKLLDDVSQRFPDSSWWRPPTTDKPREWAIIGGATHEGLDNDLPSWKQLFLNIERERSWGHYRFGLASDSRFGESDLTFSIGGDILLGPGWSAGIDVAIVDEPWFQPDLSYRAFALRSLQDGWVVNLLYQRREYATTAVSSITPSVEKYIGDFRFAYALGYSRLQGGGGSFNHNLTGNWYYSDRANVGINISTGEESEAIGAGQVLQTDVRGIGVNGQHALNDRTDLKWWLGSHEQGNFYRRSFLGMAIAFRF